MAAFPITPGSRQLPNRKTTNRKSRERPQKGGQKNLTQSRKGAKVKRGKYEPRMDYPSGEAFFVVPRHSANQCGIRQCAGCLIPTTSRSLIGCQEDNGGGLGRATRVECHDRDLITSLW